MGGGAQGYARRKIALPARTKDQGSGYYLPRKKGERGTARVKLYLAGKSSPTKEEEKTWMFISLRNPKGCWENVKGGYCP